MSLSYDLLQLKHEMSNIIKDMIVNYTGVNRTAERTWDYIQKSVRRCYVSVIYSARMTDLPQTLKQAFIVGPIGNVLVVRSTNVSPF